MLKNFEQLKTGLSQNLINIPGSRLRRKIVVIESDDWGSIRMPSKEIYLKFIERGFNIANSEYNRMDSIESDVDLEMLFTVLKSFRDSKGKHPVLTANVVVGNPDFQIIKQSGFEKYHFESVTTTLERYPGRKQVESLWKQGDIEGIFHPQFHGREHVNVVRWMNALRERSDGIMFTFKHETTFSGEGDYNFMEVLDYNHPGEIPLMKNSLREGLDLFEKIFGYRSRSFIPPCYTWDSNVEETLSECGVKYIQGLAVQSVPTGSFGNYRRKFHYLGQKNRFGQYFLLRNAFFEPSLSKGIDIVGECLRRIDIAFKWRKPAIISAHRINFIGSLVEQNRTINLKLLDELLGRILKLWPDVEFMTSDQLGDLIAESKK